MDFHYSDSQSGFQLTKESRPVRSRAAEYWKMIISGAAFLCYAQSFAFRFVYDDRFLILTNPYITSWHYLPRFFVSDLWGHVTTRSVQYYRPLLLAWSLINYKLFGLNPVGWHVTNVVLHVIATYLVCALVEKLTPDRGIAWLSGLLFALHPAHIEVVAWASAGSEMLLTIFVIACMLCSLRADAEGKIAWRIAAWLFYVAALLTKETAIMMPAILFLYAWLYQGSEQESSARLRTALREVAPLAIVSVVYLALRFMVLGGQNYAVANPISFTTMIRTWPWLLCFYLRLMAFPFGLSPLYNSHLVHSWSGEDFVLPVLLLMVLGMAVVLWARRDDARLVLFACSWGLWLVPALFIRAFSPDKLANDRYAYLPSVGACILVAAMLRHIKLSRRKVFGVPAPQVGVVLAVILVMGYGIFSQLGNWSSDLLLFYRASRIAPRNYSARVNLAGTLMDQGHYGQAIPIFAELLQENSKYSSVAASLGYAYYNLGNLQQTKEYSERAIEADPKNADAHTYLGLAEMKLGDLGRAAYHLSAALALDPQQQQCHSALGLILERQGKKEEALRAYEAELNLQPDNAALREHVRQLRQESARK